MKLSKVKKQCRRYGVSLVAMLSLLGIGSFMQSGHIHADQTNQTTSNTTAHASYNIQNNQSRNTYSQNYNQPNNEDEASNEVSHNNGVNQTPLITFYNSLPTANNSANNGLNQVRNQNIADQSRTASRPSTTYPFNARAFQESNQINQNFVRKISPAQVNNDLRQYLLSHPAQNDTEANVSERLATPKLGASSINSEDESKSVHSLANQMPNDGFKQFLGQVDNYVSSHAKGNKNDIKEAEAETAKDAEEAMYKYEQKQDAEYAKKTHATKVQVQKHHRQSVNKLTNKFHRMYNIARKQLGKPYGWGANGPSSFDCSAFTKYVYYHGMHINLPRTAGAQYDVSKHVSFKHARLGDLVFFGSSKYSIGHVGIYLGHDLMIDAQLRGVIIEHVHAPWWHLVGVGRIVK